MRGKVGLGKCSLTSASLWISARRRRSSSSRFAADDAMVDQARGLASHAPNAFSLLHAYQEPFVGFRPTTGAGCISAPPRSLELVRGGD
jgi:hypothetical protein